VFERAEAEWPITPTSTWLETYGLDADNLRAALDWAFGSDGDVTLALRAGRAFLPACGGICRQLPLHEGRYWFDLAVSRITPQTPPDVAARLWFGKSWRDVGFGDKENFPAAAQAAALFRRWATPSALAPRCGASAAPSSRWIRHPRPPPISPKPSRFLRGEKPKQMARLTLVKQGDVRFRLGEVNSALGRV